MAATSILLSGYKGIRNNKPPEMLAPDELVAGVNIDLDNSNQPLRRQGYVRKLVQTAPHSGFGSKDETTFLFVQGSSLKSLDPAMTSATTLRSDLAAGLPMSYWEHAGRIYFTNGVQTGIVEATGARTWGLEVPGVVSLSSATGMLPEGRYKVACTFVALDGQESGAPESTVIDVTHGGITVSLPTSTDPRVVEVVVYCSNANGAQLYEAGRYAHGTATAVIAGDQNALQRPLLTQFMGPAPAGQLTFYYRGRMYVARDNLLFFSSAFGLELFSPTDFLAFPDVITIGAPVDDGFYVGMPTESVWISGVSPETFVQSSRQGWGAIPGTLVYYPFGRVSGEEEEIRAPMWLSAQGIVTGSPGGTLNNVTDKWNFTPPSRGAGLFRRQSGGLYQYIVTFTGA